ncbi:endonuclease/exonuclease/phosphatase family protein [Cooperia oncophora]
MPPKVQRAKKVLKTLSQPSSSSTSIVNSQSILSESANFENMSAMELIKNIMELNRDPAIENMLIALAEKIPKEFTDFLESDKRERSIVIADRKERRGGGVCCLVRGNLCVHRVEQVNPIKADVLCLEIFSPPKATHFRFTVVYRPPNSTRREDDGLVDVLREMVSAQVNSIIVGDLNLQVDWKNLRADNASSAAFLDFFQESGLEQHVLQPTHGSNTLDLVLSTSHSIQNVSLLPPLANSDHASVRFELLEGFSDAALLPTPDFLKVNYDRLNEYLSNVDWLGLFNNYVSMDDIYRRFCKTVYKALTLFVPLNEPSKAQALR